MYKISDLIRNINSGASAAHAYVIEDEREDVREEFIKTLTQGLECTAKDPGERPCGSCDACRQVAAGTSLDIVRMQKSGKDYYYSQDVVVFTERLDMRAYGNYLIGIIEDAGSLSEIGQNKLLKTLEEPRDSVLLLLGVANSEMLLGTVRSRVSIIRPSAFEGYEHSDENHTDEAAQNTASTMLDSNAAFHEMRTAIDKSVKTKADALKVIDALEDRISGEMRNGGRPDKSAAMLEICERARMDIERDMRIDRALKRLCLEIKGVR